jgi:hypothetical protein
MASSSVSNRSILQTVASCRVDRSAKLQPHHGSPHSGQFDAFDSVAHRQIHYLPSAGFQVLLLDLADCQNDEGHLVLRRTLHRAPLHEKLDLAAATRLADRETQARRWPVVVCDAQGGRRRVFHERIVPGRSGFGVFVARGPEVDVGALCGIRMARDVRPLMSWTFRHLDSAAGFVNQQLERPGRRLIHLLEPGSILFVATGLDHPIVYRRAIGTRV